MSVTDARKNIAVFQTCRLISARPSDKSIIKKMSMVQIWNNNEWVKQKYDSWRKNCPRVISSTTNPTAVGLKSIPIFQIANIQIFLHTRGTSNFFGKSIENLKS
jgi:hypothetical protein